MDIPKLAPETILPLTNSRGFKKILRFNYRVGSKWRMPLVVAPQILSLGDPFYTRQALYFLSDVDCAIRIYTEATTGHAAGQDEESLSRVRSVADDCLFEYSLRNPASRLSTRSELPPGRRSWERTEITLKQPGLSDASYTEVDNGRVWLTKESKHIFEQLLENFVGDIHDQDVGRNAFGDRADAFPLGLCPDDHGTAPVRFMEMPYTFEELDLLSRIVPIDPEMIGKFSASDLLKVERDEASREAIVAILNQPYTERIGRLPPAKYPEPEIINVGNTYDPRLLDFYFAGLRSLSPVVEFKNYYNIIEYFFEESDPGKKETELEKIRQVVQSYTTLGRLRAFFNIDIPTPARIHFKDFNGVVNGGTIQKVRWTKDDLHRQVADRIYSFRNAIFHSKRTFNGKETVVIRPCSTQEAEVVAHEVRLIKMVAQEIIKQT